MDEQQTSHAIHIYNGLIDPKHVKAMGSAIWEYLWCLDHQTTADGLVHKGVPIHLSEIADQIGRHTVSVSENLTRLRNGGYLETKRTPYGLVIRVTKPKKFNKRFSQMTNSEPERFSQNTNSGFSHMANSHKEKTKSPSENTKSNYDTTVDTTIETTVEEEPPANIRDCIRILVSIPGYSLGMAETGQLLAGIFTDYPNTDKPAELRAMRDWVLDNPSKKTKNWRMRVRNWMKNAKRFSAEDTEVRRHGDNGRGSNDKPGKYTAAVQRQAAARRAAQNL